MAQWIRQRLTNLLDSLIVAAIIAGGGVLWAAIKHLPADWVVALGIFLFAFVLIVLRLLLHWLNDAEKPKPNLERGKQIHLDIINLFNDLGNIKNKQAKDNKWQTLPEVRLIMDNLQIKFNDLGYLVKKEKYARWAESLMTLTAKELDFHYNEHNSINEWGRARINSTLRSFVHGIKG